ncbi:MAG: DUF3732 domain-containing protein [Fimbriimonadales bacterium]
MIPIIDYCLGSGTCTIPVDTIRNACDWFGIIVATAGGQMLLARREPGTQRSTDDMMIIQADRIGTVPDRPGKNTTADAVKRLLDEQAGLTSLETSTGGEASGFEGRPSFRDLAAFLFQPQNVVANPDVLFYKTSTYEHREKLRNIFPYVLGAITGDLLAKQHELARVRASLKRLQRELATAESVSAQWDADLQARLSEARELGLILIPSGEVLTREQALAVLVSITTQQRAEPAVTTETINEALRELAELESEESEVSTRLTSLRRRLAEMQRVQSALLAHGDSRQLQRERLGISNWLLAHADQENPCPMCGNELSSANAVLETLVTATRALEDAAGTSDAVSAAFDREHLRVSTEVETRTEQLRGIQVRRRALEMRSEQSQAHQYRARAMERFLGNVENALKLQERLGEDGELRSETNALSEREALLAAELQRENLEERKGRALDQVNLLAGRLISDLDSEFPNAPISLQINDLTIKVSRPDREDILPEIGSGSNWLSYHLATLLALHQFFLGLARSPVPNFLILDQPSQVYFPKRLVPRPDDPLDEQLKDEDVEAVRKAFATMAKVVEEAQQALQIIVLDHAARNVWGDIPLVHEVEEWRGDEKLVPLTWLAE